MESCLLRDLEPGGVRELQKGSEELLLPELAENQQERKPAVSS